MTRFLFVLVLGAASSFSLLAADEKAQSTQSYAELEAPAKEAAQRLMKSLKTNLMKAMAREGIVGAAQFCNVKAVPLTEGVSSSLKEGWTVSRVSQKNRSPKNAPDKWDEKAFSQHKEKPDLGHYWVEEKSEEGALLASRFYLPMKVGGQCIGCHGTNISKPMKDFLSEKYPEDKATGYKPGDFRGFVRVRIPR